MSIIVEQQVQRVVVEEIAENQIQVVHQVIGRDVVVQEVAGPPGPPGADGADGADGAGIEQPLRIDSQSIDYADLRLENHAVLRLLESESITVVSPFIAAETSLDVSSPAYQPSGDSRNLAIGGKQGVRVHNLDAGTSMLLKPEGLTVSTDYAINRTGGTSLVVGTDVAVTGREDVKIFINRGTDKRSVFSVADHTLGTILEYDNDYQGVKGRKELVISPDGAHAAMRVGDDRVTQIHRLDYSEAPISDLGLEGQGIVWHDQGANVLRVS